MLCLCACEGNWSDINLKDPVEIPEDGVIKESVLKQVKQENAIAVFTGKSGDYKYEWTIFGSDIAQPKEINLGVVLRKTADGNIQVAPAQKESYGFSALLSIYLDEQWNTQSATAFRNETAVTSVSVTGSKRTILNLYTDGTLGEVIIRPDDLPEEESDTTPAENAATTPSAPTGGQDEYLSAPNGGKDQYLTDPVPEGKPKPVEPEDQEVDTETAYTCTFSIECSTILNNLDMLDPDKLEMVPSGGVILKKTKVTFYEGESVFDVLQRVCKEKGIHMEASWTPIYNSAYVEGIHNLYEFDCGALSGWMYKVNGWYPNYGCSRYQLKDGDTVQWRFTCDLGNDIGGGYAVGG